MENIFIEFLDAMYWAGYGIAFKEENPTAFGQQLTKFMNLQITVRVRVEKTLYKLDDAVSVFEVDSSPAMVKVLAIMNKLTESKHPKN